ncbi:MAG: hypothetical protein WC663_01955 [Patescibacteria group bacterium]|jgi:hypothetical protein
MTKEDIKEMRKIVSETTGKLIKDSEERMEKKMRIVFCEGAEKLILPSVKSMIKDSENKIDLKLEKQKKEIVHELQDSNDALAKEVKDFREEQASKSYVLEQLDEKYIDHEKRIIVLEEKTA